MKLNSGFTLIELLIALLISSFVIMGTYSLLDSTINAREYFSSQQNYQKIYKSLYQLINDDIISSADKQIRVQKSPMDDNSEVSFHTQNSLYFNQSMGVDVSYYVDDDGWLVREENHKILENPMIIKLINNVNSFTVRAYNGNEYSERSFETKLLKFNIDINGRKYEVVTGAF
ncbi:prepilin-type N-terminal cleavage/methylation domain-containing protein [Flexistipes sp.]|uniref:prepilin-type N-terminal cleavage/methylation domain-containing protein n=1 Tax=Flexistipes sp. TaxID=3088135 RepID=UPI002E1AAEDF|nr:prepilin-type N-terminal cleavage/methylation domain-containing protein [Flexistipes sp.]